MLVYKNIHKIVFVSVQLKQSFLSPLSKEKNGLSRKATVDLFRHSKSEDT